MHIFRKPLIAIVLNALLLGACTQQHSVPSTSTTSVKEQMSSSLGQSQETEEVEKTNRGDPCWVNSSKCKQVPGFAYFTGSIKQTTRHSQHMLRRAAVQGAISQLAEHLEMVIESEVWQETICGNSRCKHEAGKRVVATAMLGIRGRDFEMTEEYSDQEWLHVRVRIPHVFLEDRLNQATEAP
jgi:hypothetical protein